MSFLTRGRERPRYLVTRLTQDALDDVSVDIGEPVVSALEAVGEPGMVEAEKMQKGGIEVMNVDGVFGHIESSSSV